MSPVSGIGLIAGSTSSGPRCCRNVEDLYDAPGYPGGAEFALAVADGAEADFSTYLAEIEQSRLVVAGRSLDETFGDATMTVDLRWLYAHMIDEYTRHNGHADVIRELVDGATGY